MSKRRYHTRSSVGFLILAAVWFVRYIQRIWPLFHLLCCAVPCRAVPCPRYRGDHKGCVLIACWGVPGRSYPDNGNRCLAAAVEIHASLQVRDMKTSMGITTGHVGPVVLYSTIDTQVVAIFKLERQAT